MTISVSNKDFKKLQKNPIMIKKIFNFYRSGYVKAENKYHTYIYFPSRLSDKIVYSEDKVLTKNQEGERMELREQIWNKDEKKFEFHKLNSRIDLKAFKKVVDVVAVAQEDFEITQYDKFTKSRQPFFVNAGDEFVIESFSAWKVRDLLDALDLADDITPDPTTEKRAFDWEDAIKGRLERKAFTFKVTWVKLDTKYIFKEAPAFEVTQDDGDKPISIEDIPFR